MAQQGKGLDRKFRWYTVALIAAGSAIVGAAATGIVFRDQVTLKVNPPSKVDRCKAVMRGVFRDIGASKSFINSVDKQVDDIKRSHGLTDGMAYVEVANYWSKKSLDEQNLNNITVTALGGPAYGNSIPMVFRPLMEDENLRNKMVRKFSKDPDELLKQGWATQLQVLNEIPIAMTVLRMSRIGDREFNNTPAFIVANLLGVQGNTELVVKYKNRHIGIDTAIEELNMNASMADVAYMTWNQAVVELMWIEMGSEKRLEKQLM